MRRRGRQEVRAVRVDLVREQRQVSIDRGDDAARGGDDTGQGGGSDTLDGGAG
jgi:hypothetical protein